MIYKFKIIDDGASIFIIAYTNNNKYAGKATRILYLYP